MANAMNAMQEQDMAALLDDRSRVHIPVRPRRSWWINILRAMRITRLFRKCTCDPAPESTEEA